MKVRELLTKDDKTWYKYVTNKLLLILKVISLTFQKL